MLYPLTSDLHGSSVLVVGAGRIGSRKIGSLVNAGARVTVVSPEATPEVRMLASINKIVWKQRTFRLRDLRKQYLAVAATHSSAINARVFSAGERRQILVNSVDDPANCSFHVPARISRGKLEVAISTSGTAPYFARRFKTFLDQILPSDLGSRIEKIGEIRRSVLEDAPTNKEKRATLVREALDPEIDGLLENIQR